MSNQWLKAARCGLVAVVFAGSAASVGYGWPWSKDMYKQPSIQPLEAPRVPPAHSIPRQGKEPQMDRIRAGETLRNPLKPTASILAKGKHLYEMYCTLCHGADGKGRGPISSKFIPPPDLTLDVFRGRPDGFLYQTIRDGGPIMPPQAEALTPQERWAIVHHLRRLQSGEQ